MSEDLIHRLMTKLDRIAEDVAAIKAREEEKSKRCESHGESLEKMDTRLDTLERKVNEYTGIKGFIAWFISTGIAIWAVVKDHIWK